jgi:hypothetical protein
LTRFVEIFIGQRFYAHEFFVRARFAQMFRRCIAFSALLSVRRKKTKQTTAEIRLGESPLRREKLLLCRPQADCDGSPCVNDVIAGFA